MDLYLRGQDMCVAKSNVYKLKGYLTRTCHIFKLTLNYITMKESIISNMSGMQNHTWIWEPQVLMNCLLILVNQTNETMTCASQCNCLLISIFIL